MQLIYQYLKSKVHAKSDILCYRLRYIFNIKDNQFGFFLVLRCLFEKNS